MARKLATEGDPENEPPHDGESDCSVRLSRRGYVGLASTALASVVSIPGVTGASSGVATRSNAEDRRAVRIVGSGDISKYEFTVGGDLVPGAGGSKDASARISGTSAEGVVTAETRTYLFSGEIRDFHLEGDAGVYFQREGRSSELSLKNEEYASREPFLSASTDP